MQCCPPLPLSLLPLQAISDNSDKLVAHADADERAALAGYTGGKCDKPTVVAAGCEQPAKVGKNYAVQVGAGPQGGPGRMEALLVAARVGGGAGNRAGLTGMVCCDVAFLSTGGSLRCRQTLLPCTTMGPMQVNVTCGDTTIGYVALVATDGASYWNVRCFERASTSGTFSHLTCWAFSHVVCRGMHATWLKRLSMSMLLIALLPPLFPLQVEDSSLDFVEIGGSTTPGLTVTQGADLLVSPLLFATFVVCNLQHNEGRRGNRPFAVCNLRCEEWHSNRTKRVPG